MQLVDKRALTDWLEGKVVEYLTGVADGYDEVDMAICSEVAELIDDILIKIHGGAFDVMFKVEELDDGTWVCKTDLS